MVQCWCWLQDRSFQHVTLWWCPTVTHLGFVFTPSARLDPCNSQLFGLTLSPRKVKLRHKWITSKPKQEEACFSSYHRGFKTVPNRPTLPLTEHWDLGFYKESPKNTSLFRSIQFCWCGLAAGRLHFYCQNMLQRLTRLLSTARMISHKPLRPQSHKYTSCWIDIYSTRPVLKAVSMNSRKTDHGSVDTGVLSWISMWATLSDCL